MQSTVKFAWMRQTQEIPIFILGESEYYVGHRLLYPHQKH